MLQPTMPTALPPGYDTIVLFSDGVEAMLDGCDPFSWFKLDTIARETGTTYVSLPPRSW